MNVFSIIDQKDLCLIDDDIKHYLAKIRVSLTKLYFLLSKTFFDSSDSMTNVYSAEKRSFAMHLETHFLFQNQILPVMWIKTATKDTARMVNVFV